MRTLLPGRTWFQQFRVPATWTAADGPRSLTAKLVAPARDTPRRWLLVWVALLLMGALSFLSSSVRNGFGLLDVLVVPLLGYLLLTDLMRARTLLLRTG